MQVHYMKFFSYSMFTLAVFMVSSIALAREVTSLKDAITLGLYTNPEYTTVTHDKNISKETLIQEESSFLPSIDMRAETGWDHTKTPVINTDDLWRNQVSVTLSQMLFDGFRTESAVNKQRARITASENRIFEKSELIGLDIIEAYLEVLRQRDILMIARANIQDHLYIQEMIKASKSSGISTDGDLAQVTARVASARANEISVRQRLRDAEALFIRKVGNKPGSLSFPYLPRQSILFDVEETVESALTHNPTIAAFESDIKAAEADYKGSGSNLYPQVDFELNGSYGSDLNGVQGDETRATALTVMRWNLYKGGADKARQKEFMYRHAQAKDRRAETARQIEQDIRQSWSGMKAAGEQSIQYKEQAKANERVVSVYIDQFSINRRTLLDVLDSQGELFSSRSNHINSLYTEALGIYRLLALQGKLFKTLGINKVL